MGRRQGAETDVADPALAARLHPDERRKEVPFEAERARGAGRREQRAAEPRGERERPDRVVAVLVRDEDRADRLGRDPPRDETLLDLLRRKPGVHEHPRFPRLDDAGVATRAGGENGNAHERRLAERDGTDEVRLPRTFLRCLSEERSLPVIPRSIPFLSFRGAFPSCHSEEHSLPVIPRSIPFLSFRGAFPSCHSEEHSLPVIPRSEATRNLVPSRERPDPSLRSG